MAFTVSGTTRVQLSFLRLGFSLMPTRVFPEGWFQAQQTAKRCKCERRRQSAIATALAAVFHLKF